MKTKIRAILLPIMLVASFGGPGPARADAVEDGVAALTAGDTKKAFELWRPLAEQGDAAAQMLLGSLYERGAYVKQDNDEALKWYRLSAEQGEPLAQFNLAGMYARGQGTDRDFQLAYIWYTLSASQGFPAAAQNREAAARFLTPQQLIEAEGTVKQCRALGYKGCE